MKWKNNFPLIFAVSVIVVGLFVYIGSSVRPAQKVAIAPTAVYVPPPIGTQFSLTQLNNSNVEGYFKVREIEGRVVININLTKLDNQLTESELPAALYNGTCKNPGAVKYPLSRVIDGGSETSLPVVPSDFVPTFPLALIVMRSPQDQTSVACGDISSVASFK